MLDLITSLLKTLESFSKDFGVWMEWGKSDCASTLIGTIAQYEEVVLYRFWSGSNSRVSFSTLTYARAPAAQGALKFFA